MLINKFSKSLLYYYVFYKHFYRFVFLHKPLCKKYRNFSFQIGDMYFCKSCAILYTGLFLSAVFLLSAPNTAVLAILCLLTGVVSYPVLYAKFSRPLQYLIRFTDGFALGAFVIWGFSKNLWLGCACVLTFGVIKTVYNKIRKSKDICKGCESLQKGGVCEGYCRQKEMLSRIEEEYSKKMSETYIKKKGE